MKLKNKTFYKISNFKIEDLGHDFKNHPWYSHKPTKWNKGAFVGSKISINLMLETE